MCHIHLRCHFINCRLPVSRVQLTYSLLTFIHHFRNMHLSLAVVIPICVCCSVLEYTVMCCCCRGAEAEESRKDDG